MADQNEAPVASRDQALQRAVEILGAVFKSLVSCAAKLRQIAGPRNPIMTARVDDERVIAMFGESLSEGRQRRQIKIHCHAVHEQERKIRLKIPRRKQQAVQRFFVAGFETEQLGFDGHRIEVIIASEMALSNIRCGFSPKIASIDWAEQLEIGAQQFGLDGGLYGLKNGR